MDLVPLITIICTPLSSAFCYTVTLADMIGKCDEGMYLKKKQKILIAAVSSRQGIMPDNVTKPVVSDFFGGVKRPPFVSTVTVSLRYHF
ncbi:TPA: hypothetical protein ACIBQR_002724 [Salmonella enterica subsp. enterica serovar Chester]